MLSFTTLRWSVFVAPRISPISTVPRFKSFTRRCISDVSEVKKTALYDFHVKNGGKMVEFGGFYMPVQYSDQSIIDSHKWTRAKSSLWDVSHMLQHRFTGPGACEFLQYLTPSSLNSLPPFHSTLSCFLHPHTGGIIDDTMITKLEDPNSFYVVTNAGCRDKDIAHISEQLSNWKKEGKPDVLWKTEPKNNLIALQGPLAAEVMAMSFSSSEDEKRLANLYFGQSGYFDLRSTNPTEIARAFVSRSGYTGEDGFEISFTPSVDITSVVNSILKVGGRDRVRLAGLASRDTLRLEAGLCLYGSDLNDSTTPVEASLSWIIGKDRLNDPTGFLGAETILAQVKSSVKSASVPEDIQRLPVNHRRIGIVAADPRENLSCARAGAQLYGEVDSDDSSIIGNVTSGSPSPSLNGVPIGMAYVKVPYNKIGTRVWAKLRSGKRRCYIVSRMPFIKNNYYRAASR